MPFFRVANVRTLQKETLNDTAWERAKGSSTYNRGGDDYLKGRRWDPESQADPDDRARIVYIPGKPRHTVNGRSEASFYGLTLSSSGRIYTKTII